MEIRKDTYYSIYFTENDEREERTAVKEAQKLLDKGYDFVVGEINQETGLFSSVYPSTDQLVCVQLVRNSTVKKI